jgi:membrane fusion protein (multidrug efflux system)
MAEGSSIHRLPASGAGNAARDLRKEPELEAPAQPAPAATKTAESAPAPKAAPRRRWRRPLLFALLPLALIAGGYFYMTGGQVMSTDNAYVQADMIGVSTDVAGTVIGIEVRDNEAVKKGQILYRLNPNTFQITLDGAKAQLGTVHDQVLTLQATYKLALAQVDQAQADLTFYQTNFKRQQDLLATGAGTKAVFDVAEHDLEATRQRIAVAKAQAATSLAQLSGDPNQKIEDNPFYRQAKSIVDNAQRDLDDTIVRAPFDGVVTKVEAIRVGSYLQAYVRTGQPATVTVDAYPGVEWKGEVESLSPASGSSFSLLPAQNTTGNWVKVVQRIPLRVRIDDMAGKPPLRVGMSVSLDIDTGHARGLPEFVAKLIGRDEKSHG